MSYTAISLNRQEDYLKILAACPQRTSDYSFINIWAWADEYGLEWAWEESLVWIRQSKPEIRHWAPVGEWEGVDWPKRMTDMPGDRKTFLRVPEMLIRLWKQAAGDRMAVAEDRGHWDYLYEAAALRELAGNRFHKKKNLVKQFSAKYPHVYQILDKDSILGARDMQNTWCEWRDCESNETLAAENRAIERVFAAWESLRNLLGGALIVEGDMAAYTVGERLSQEMLLIHFEKGKPEIKGIYQAINQAFLATQTDVAIVNREQDLDDEGLRKAKLSYHPVDFLRKYQVEWK